VELSEINKNYEEFIFRKARLQEKKGQKPKKLAKSLKTRIYNFIEECVNYQECYEMCYKDTFGRMVEIKKGLNRNKLIEILWDEFLKKTYEF
jgi:NAD-dependent dihydropyrimidine dehydrogenase PreA subunit